MLMKSNSSDCTRRVHINMILKFSEKYEFLLKTKNKNIINVLFLFSNALKIYRF